MSHFPHRRLRRLRRSSALRTLFRETRLSPSDLIQPIFVVENEAAAVPVASMPCVSRYALAELPRRIDQIRAAGVRSVLLFGIPSTKDALASAARAMDSVVPRAIETCRRSADDLVIITDVCVCSYTDHGHCGMIANGAVENDTTLPVLAEMAVAHARAGADIIAPSAMMDGQVAAIRTALDTAGFAETAILAYSAKFASSFYGPFREAADSTPGFGDRRAYQMDPANAREAVAEARMDAEEGADALMVKPALPYLDRIAEIKRELPDWPLAAYQVSGEYAMIAAAAARGWLNERATALESLTAIKRAGADLIITYYADRVAGWLAE